jgi:PAS domain S-box-containing protein
LYKIAEKYGLRTEELLKCALQYESRPPFIIDIAKNRLLTSARLIGEIIERRQVEEALKKHRENLEEIVKERTRELRDAELKYRTVADFTYDWEYWRNLEGRFLYISPSCERITGYGVREFQENPSLVMNIVVADDRDVWVEHLREGLKEVGPGEIQFRIKRKDDEIRWIEHFCQPVLNGQGIFLGTRASNRDITDRKRSEEALRESENRLRLLSSQLLSIQEKERKRVASELHDGIGQMLTAVKFKIEDIIQQKGESEAKEKSLEAIIPMIQESIEEVRRIQMDLRPPILDDLGVLATIGWFCRKFQRVYSAIRIETQIGIQENEVSAPLKTVIYRVMQEALNNIAKHSGADLVYLMLRRTQDKIEMVIQDNGQGFDLEDVRQGFGMGSMRERTELSGGSFIIESVRGKGAAIRASWPIDQLSA